MMRPHRILDARMGIVSVVHGNVTVVVVDLRAGYGGGDRIGAAMNGGSSSAVILIVAVAGVLGWERTQGGAGN